MTGELRSGRAAAPRPVACELPAERPALAIVMGSFSDFAGMRDWRDLDEYLNPEGLFREVDVLALGDDHTYVEREFGSIRVHPRRSPTRRPRLRRVDDLWLLLAGVVWLDRIVRRRRIDVIAQTWSTPIKYGLPAVLVARRRRLPVVLTLCNDYRTLEDRRRSPVARLYSRIAWPALLGRATLVRSKSRQSAGFAVERGVPPERIRIVPNKEAPELFRAPPSPLELECTAEEFGVGQGAPGEVVLLTVARLVEAKNLERCIRAFAAASERHAGMTYLIAGSGPLRRPLVALAARLGVSDRVRFLGQLPHSRLRLAYHLADVFLFPTLAEGQPRALLEALFAGLPVICSKGGSVEELVRDGEDGICVDARSVPEIAGAILRFAGSPELRRAMSAHAGFEPERFSIREVAAQEAELYREALRGARSA